MSWSISLIGKPEAIVKALKENSEKLSSPSKEEYNAALPHIEGLVMLNVQENQQAIKVTANGHAYTGYSSCQVNIEVTGHYLTV